MQKVLEFVAVAKKFCVALSAALTVTATVLADGAVTLEEALALVAAYGGAVGVFWVTNKK